MDHDDEIQMHINEIHRLKKFISDESKNYGLIKKLIPNFGKYEDEANRLIGKYGLRKAFLTAREIKL